MRPHGKASFTVGQKGGLSSPGRVGFVALNSPGIGAALASLVSYLSYRDRAASVTLTADGSPTLLSHAIHHCVDAQDQIVDGAHLTAARRNPRGERRPLRRGRRAVGQRRLTALHNASRAGRPA